MCPVQLSLSKAKMEKEKKKKRKKSETNIRCPQRGHSFPFQKNLMKNLITLMRKTITVPNKSQQVRSYVSCLVKAQ